MSFNPNQFAKAISSAVTSAAAAISALTVAGGVPIGDITEKEWLTVLVMAALSFWQTYAVPNVTPPVAPPVIPPLYAARAAQKMAAVTNVPTEPVAQ